MVGLGFRYGNHPSTPLTLSGGCDVRQGCFVSHGSWSHGPGKCLEVMKFDPSRKDVTRNRTQAGCAWGLGEKDKFHWKRVILRSVAKAGGIL